MACRSRDFQREASSVILITFLVLLSVSTLSYVNRLTLSKDLDDEAGSFSSQEGFYVEDLASTDMLLWTEVAYVSNTTGNHRLEYDLDPSFESVDDVLWSNDTDTPQFFILQSSYNINETVFYRVTIGGYQETGSFTYFSTPSDEISNRITFPRQAYHGGTHSPPGSNIARVIWVDPVTNNWTIKKGTGNLVVFYQSSDRGLHWTRVGSTLSVDDDLPPGWTHVTSGAEFAYDGTYYYLVLAGNHELGRGSFIYRGTSLSNLAYEGRLCYYGSGFPNLTVNCRSHDLWYNETDGKMWFAVGGAENTKGSWKYVYKVCDTDGDLCLDDEVPILLFDVSDWGKGGWSRGLVHPFNQIWWDWANNRGMGVVVGCGSATPDYDFESGLAFPTSPMPSGGSPTYFYNNITDEKGYFGWAFDTGGSASVEMTDINDACIIWENNGAIFAKMRESGIVGNPDPDKGDQWLGVVRGFWPDVKIGVEPGYARVTRYYELPSETDFRVNMLPVELWTTRLVNCTWTYVDGSPPIYAKWAINKTGEETRITVKIEDLTTDTCYLHRTSETGCYEYTITDSGIGAIATLTPAGTGDDFMFSLVQDK